MPIWLIVSLTAFFAAPLGIVGYFYIDTWLFYRWQERIMKSHEDESRRD
jgi:hypothetical protein